MSQDSLRNVNETPIQRPVIDYHERSSRARRKSLFSYRSLMQRFIPFAEKEQRRKRRSSSRASLSIVPIRRSSTPIPELNATQVLEPKDELDLSSDEEDMLTAYEDSDSSHADSWVSIDSSVELSGEPIQAQALVLPSAQPNEGEPMDISYEDCENDNYSDSSDEELARVCTADDFDNDSLSSWSSSSSNGRVNRPGRHADSVLDTVPASYSVPQAPVQIASPFAQPQPQVPTPMLYVYGHPQLGESGPPIPYMYEHPQVRGMLPIDPLLGMLPSTLPYEETQPRKMPRRPFEAPYHLEDMSRTEYRRQQSRLRISRRLAIRFSSYERVDEDRYTNDHFQ